MGASTCGVRTPPRTLPLASVANTTGDTPVVSSHGAVGGGVPSATQRSSHAIAAFITQCIGPVLIGRLHEKLGLGWLVGFCIASRLSTAP